MGQFISFKSEINNPWFNPWFILLHTHSNVCATVEGRCLEYLVCITLHLPTNPILKIQYFPLNMLILRQKSLLFFYLPFENSTTRIAITDAIRCNNLCLKHYLVDIHSRFYAYLGNNLIAEGESSDEFYFFTLPSSPPADLKCKTESHSLSLRWRDPIIGMIENVTYQYSYDLIAGMFIAYPLSYAFTY